MYLLLKVLISFYYWFWIAAIGYGIFLLITRPMHHKKK